MSLSAGKSGYWAVIFFQQVASIGNNITIQIVAGQALKVSIAPHYLCSKPDADHHLGCRSSFFNSTSDAGPCVKFCQPLYSAGIEESSGMICDVKLAHAQHFLLK